MLAASVDLSLLGQEERVIAAAGDLLNFDVIKELDVRVGDVHVLDDSDIGGWVCILLLALGRVISWLVLVLPSHLLFVGAEAELTLLATSAGEDLVG